MKPFKIFKKKCRFEKSLLILSEKGFSEEYAESLKVFAFHEAFSPFLVFTHQPEICDNNVVSAMLQVVTYFIKNPFIIYVARKFFPTTINFS